MRAGSPRMQCLFEQRTGQCSLCNKSPARAKRRFVEYIFLDAPEPDIVESHSLLEQRNTPSQSKTTIRSSCDRKHLHVSNKSMQRTTRTSIHNIDISSHTHTHPRSCKHRNMPQLCALRSSAPPPNFQVRALSRTLM